MHEAIELFKHVINPQWIFEHGGLWLLLFVIFAETGLFVGFFFPGDSLLFVTGMSLSAHPITLSNGMAFNVWSVIVLVIIAGILGNLVGYWFGAKSGPILFSKKESLLFKPKHLQAAKDFYEKRGAMAIVFARFLPFLRTFAPIVAGIVKMDRRKFLIYNVFGCIAWVCAMILMGYFLGQQFPGLEKHLDKIVIGIVLVTTAPILFKVFFGKKSEKPASH
jgi:membrane-associated protein